MLSNICHYLPIVTRVHGNLEVVGARLQLRLQLDAGEARAPHPRHLSLASSSKLFIFDSSARISFLRWREKEKAVMDPVSSLSLACNILQLVELSSKIVIGAADLYREGANQENAELKDVRMQRSSMVLLTVAHRLRRACCDTLPP